MTDIILTSELTAEYVQHMGDDNSIAWAAMVSTGNDRAALPENGGLDGKKKRGLINYLMKKRHGCYTPDTEVLTKDGWKFWPEVTDKDVFATVNLESQAIEYQAAQRIVAEDYEGEMYQFANKHVSLQVTPNHNMIAAHRINAQGQYSPFELVRADNMVDRAYRLPKAMGVWAGEALEWSDAQLALLGFFIGDGHNNDISTTPVFNIRKDREISFLNETVAQISGATVSLLASGARSVKGLERNFVALLRTAYSSTKEKQIPEGILAGTPDQLTAVLSGLLASDGYSFEHKQQYFTTSALLRDQMQELSMKLGIACDYKLKTATSGKYAGEGSKPIFEMNIYKGRNAQPRLGWTTTDRAREITTLPYSGKVYCATVPNGTLFVRRNGQVAWCGNSPFEHNAMTFHVVAPIFVFREFMRHRIASYNEMSARYKELPPRFYVYPEGRPLVQAGSSAHPDLQHGDEALSKLVAEQTVRSYEVAWDAYQKMIEGVGERGAALEVARAVLPVAVYSEMYVTMNARALMNFLSLRVDAGEASAYETKPQYEIQKVAEQMEAAFAEHFPLTHEAFVKNGRVAP